MLGHYLAVALRNIVRYRLHTAVSVVVLTLGLTCFLAAYLVVSYLTSYDRDFPNTDRSIVVFQAMHGPKFGLEWPSYPYSSVLLGEQLALDVPELAAVARYRPIGASVTVDGEQKPRLSIALAEPKFLSIFPFPTKSTPSVSSKLHRPAAISQYSLNAADAPSACISAKM